MCGVIPSASYQFAPRSPQPQSSRKRRTMLGALSAFPFAATGTTSDAAVTVAAQRQTIRVAAKPASAAHHDERTYGSGLRARGAARTLILGKGVKRVQSQHPHAYAECSFRRHIENRTGCLSFLDVHCLCAFVCACSCACVCARVHSHLPNAFVNVISSALAASF